MSELKQYCEDMYGEPMEVEFGHFYLKSEADNVIAHNKYKRCLAMAKICENRLGSVVKPGWWDKWRKIWLALAEDPTWAKFLQLIHKETAKDGM